MQKSKEIIFSKHNLLKKTKKPFLDTKNYKVPNINAPQPFGDIWMEFSLEWTNYQAHRVNDDSPVEIILNGIISSNNPEIWSLTSIQPIFGALPNLYFVADVLGQSDRPYGDNIPLNWELSLNGGMFEPMMCAPDNSIYYIFPPGNHTFQLKIRGFPIYHHANGYYKLVLSQSITPQL